MSLGELFGIIPLAILRGVFFVFGTLWGSFLNVVIYRLPREMSVVTPASHCPGCGKPIAPYDNIPLLTWLILRGKARCCGVRVSPRYFFVELLGGGISLAIFEVIVRDLPLTMSAGRGMGLYGATFVLCMGLLAAAFIDAEHMFLPDSVNFGGLILAIASAGLRDLSYKTSIIGALVGFLGVFIPFIFLYKGLLGRTGMGLGDAKLLAVAGAWFGWEGAVFTLFAGAFQGSIYALALKILGIQPKLPDAVQADIAELEKLAAEGDEEAKKALAEDPLTEDENDAFILRWLGIKRAPEPSSEPQTSDEQNEEPEPPRARIPFGPFLILAMLELIFAGDWIRSLLPLL